MVCTSRRTGGGEVVGRTPDRVWGGDGGRGVAGSKLEPLYMGCELWSIRIICFSARLTVGADRAVPVQSDAMTVTMVEDFIVGGQ